MNGYDAHSTAFARRGRTTVAEAAGDKRSDGKASQTKDGANRYDTSTPERRRKALAAAKRSGNPDDEAKVRRQINQEANSTIDALMLGMARRDNRVRKQGGYRSPVTVHEVEAFAEETGVGVFEAGCAMGRPNAGWDPERMGEADKKLPPWLQKDDGEDGDSTSRRRGKMAESALNPQIRPRDTVNPLAEAKLTAKKRKALPDKAFALPGERYPIPDEAHARNALARVVQHGTPEEISKVRAAVKRKFPGIDVSGGKSSDKKKSASSGR